MNLSNLLNVFRRRIQLFLIIIALAVVLSGGYAFLATRKYDAVALVQLDVGKGESAANPADRQGLPQPDPAQFDTEIGNINSSDVARAVVKRLGLVASDEFGGGSADRDALDKTVDAVRDAVAVSRNDETYLVSIRARSKNANMAALIANAFADEALRASAARRSTAASTRAKSIAG
ncbi:Wzz/FepE/Etk N-terminal domain-containing protein, partial [Novosphingobium sp.]|uniref:Wzz/FepE/Etk N-terminal domain-containing protein n=1 Tax=Novosphingobium sp. TaxID=1874826 RepID=UPI002B45A592